MSLRELPEEVVHQIIAHVTRDARRGLSARAPVQALALAATNRRMRRAVARVALQAITWKCGVDAWEAWVRLAGSALREAVLPFCFGESSVRVMRALAAAEPALERLDVQGLRFLEGGSLFQELLGRVGGTLKSLTVSFNHSSVAKAICAVRLQHVETLTVCDAFGYATHADVLLDLLRSLKGPRGEEGSVRTLSLKNMHAAPRFATTRDLYAVAPLLESVDIAWRGSIPDTLEDGHMALEFAQDDVQDDVQCERFIRSLLNLAQLTEFTVGGLLNVNVTAFEALLNRERLPRFEKLSLIDCTCTQQYPIGKIGEVFGSRLCALRLARYRTEFHSDVLRLAENCVNLESLLLRVDATNVVHLKRVFQVLRRLRVVKLSSHRATYTSQIPNREAVDGHITSALVAAGPALTEIELVNCLSCGQLERVMQHTGESLTVLRVTRTGPNITVSYDTFFRLVTAATKYNLQLRLLDLLWPYELFPPPPDLSENEMGKAVARLGSRVAHVDLRNMAQSMPF